MDKVTVFKELAEHLKDKINEALDHIDGLKNSRDGDTKSSAGDKYETSREMVQQEIDRAEARLQQLKRQLNELNNFKGENNEHCESGALVLLEKVSLLLGPAIGKVIIQGEPLLCISMGSPIGQLLNGKKEGDKIQFNGKEQLIHKVL